MTKRDEKVRGAFKSAKAREGNDCCEVCRWRPPKVLRALAGGRIDRLLHGHHIVPVACGGADHPDNMILLCPTHHAIAHHVGRMVRDPDTAALEWLGARSRAHFLVEMELLKNADEWTRYVKRYAQRLDLYVAALHAEALEENRVEDVRRTRAFTVIRGNLPRLAS